jgi:hypothetical protein
MTSGIMGAANGSNPWGTIGGKGDVGDSAPADSDFLPVLAIETINAMPEDISPHVTFRSCSDDLSLQTWETVFLCTSCPDILRGHVATDASSSRRPHLPAGSYRQALCWNRGRIAFPRLSVKAADTPLSTQPDDAVRGHCHSADGIVNQAVGIGISLAGRAIEVACPITRG